MYFDFRNSQRVWLMQAGGNSTGAQRFDPALVSFDAAASSLTLKGMNRTLTCGEDLLLSWTGSS